MLKFLATLFRIIDTLLSAWREKQIKDQGRQEQQADDQKELQARVDQADAAISFSDPVRDERLRSRFDRSRNGQ